MGKEIKLRREEKKGKERGRKKNEKKKKKKGKKGRKKKRIGEENQEGGGRKSRFVQLYTCLLYTLEFYHQRDKGHVRVTY